MTPTTVWRISPELVGALADRLGDPVDSYLNGSQTWLEDSGPAGIAVEWRLHPVAGYRAPAGISVYELWEQVVAGIRAGRESTDLRLGEETRALESLWDGLECFPAHGDAVEPALLAQAVGDRLGIAPDRYGLVDHQRVGDEWERSAGAVSIVDLLFDQLEPTPG